jgi:aminoglycoside phosphotransferase (APT) family kinase protein
MTTMVSSSSALPDFDGLLDWPKLNAWIDSADLPGQGAVSEVKQLSGGSQNSLFLMTRGSERFVLRRPPKHLRANSNDTMAREARVLKALAGSAVPHPRLLGACLDSEVIGASFFVMQPLDGFSPLQQLEGQYATDASWRREMGPEFVRAAAALAAVDYKAVGLGDFGKPDNWHGRQVERWRSQLEGYKSMPGYDADSTLPFIDEAGRWLIDNLPKDGRIGIIHGDLQWPNAMFSYSAPKIAGLIDWELSTLGDSMLDLAWVLTSWREAGDPDVGGAAASAPVVKPWDGFVSRDDMIKLYGELTGRDMSQIPWYFVLACYKLACLLEGTYARSKSGKASLEMGVFLHNYALWLMAKARQLVAAA